MTTECEKMYAVDYVDRYYIGRVLKKSDKENFYHMKFLHKFSEGGRVLFRWPKTDDVDEVHETNIFYGPVHLEGV